MPKEKLPSAARSSATHVWFVDVANCLAALQSWQEEVRALDRATEARLALIKDNDERTTRFAVHCALRVLIEQIKGPQWRGKSLIYTDKGQPSLPGLGRSLSLSHTRDAGLIALSSAPAVGVDIEPRDRHIRMQPERQQAIISAANQLAGPARHDPAHPLAFLSAWVRLEATSKATGTGLAPLLTEAMAPLRKKTQVPTVDHAAQVAQARGSGLGSGRGLLLHDLSVPAQFVAAVALQGEEAKPKLHQFPETRREITALISMSSS